MKVKRCVNVIEECRRIMSFCAALTLMGASLCWADATTNHYVMSALPDADKITVCAEVSLRQTGAGKTEAYLGCCDPAGNLHAISLPATLDFWNPTASLRLVLDDLPGKVVRIFLFGQDLFWTSLALNTSGGRKDIFSALRVRADGADVPVEISPDGKRPLIIYANSCIGTPLLKYRAVSSGMAHKQGHAVRMKKVSGEKYVFSARLSVPANETIAYSVTAGGSIARGTTLPQGYLAAGGIPKGAVCFYVSLSGRDSFSGKLPAPNARETDGPFATIRRA